MYIRPNPLCLEENPDFVVADPVLKDKIPAAGRLVQPSGYWSRRLRDGDVVLGEEAKKEPEQKSPKKKGDE